MGNPAARIFDKVQHPLPGMLMPGPGSHNVIIGNLPAWRGLPAAAAAALQAAKAISDAVVTTAEAATVAAAGTPGAPAAIAAEKLAKAAATTAMTSLMNSLGAGCAALGGMPDTHICATPGIPPPPHGPGMVIDGSSTVLINGLPACSVGDNVLEALGPLDPIVMGMNTVLVGKSGGGGGGAGGLGSLISAAIGTFLAGLGSLADALQDILKFVRKLVNAVIDAILATITSLVRALVDPIISVLNLLVKLYEAALEAAKSPFQRAKEVAIQSIKKSPFAQTEEGKKVVAKIDELEADGKINAKKLKKTTRGEWDSDDGITVNSSDAKDPDAIASELIHEATHALNEDEFPASKSKITIDEEMRTNENQLDYYEEQRKGGFRDPELEDRRNDRAAGKLRDNVRGRYPKAAEHL